MLILRMRQAETALKDGRLDEAFELAGIPDVRSHRRGQDLIGRLVRALSLRGREHLEAGRFTQASADCEKAARLGGNLPEVAELRAALERAAVARQDQDRRKARAIGAAREHIHNGQLSVGGQWLANVDDTHRAGTLREELEARRGEVESTLARAEQAIQHEDWATAVTSLVRVNRVHSTNTQVLELSAKATALLAQRIRGALQQGRLDQAQLLAEVAAPLTATSVALTESRGTLDLVSRSAAAVAAGQCRRAIELLHQARAALPQAAWVEQALSEAQRAAEALERLRGGPLGMLVDVPPHTEAVVQDADRLMDQTVLVGAPGRDPAVQKIGEPNLAAQAGGTLPRKLVLHVDGIGSFLVLRDRSVTIGAAGGSRQPDVPLLVNSSAGLTTIERVDEDYFLSCARSVTVNGQQVERKLLGDGDRIGLSTKCHIRFTMPNAASTSALLSIAGGRLPGTDATRVVLLDRSLVIGPGNAAHVRADDLAGPVILHVRDNRLFCQTDQEVTVNGRPMDRQAGLPVDARVRIGPVSMVIRPA